MAEVKKISFEDLSDIVRKPGSASKPVNKVGAMVFLRAVSSLVDREVVVAHKARAGVVKVLRTAKGPILSLIPETKLVDGVVTGTGLPRANVCAMVKAVDKRLQLKKGAGAEIIVEGFGRFKLRPKTVEFLPEAFKYLRRDKE